MKSMNVVELDVAVSELNNLRFAQLQEVYTDGRSLVLLKLRLPGEDRWLVVDLNHMAPAVMLLAQWPFAIPKVKKPVQLFLHAHFCGLRLLHAVREKAYGRVVRIEFGAQEGEVLAQLEIRLIPKSPNLIARAQDKTISWVRVRELAENPMHQEDEARLASLPSRTAQELRDEWCSQKNKERGSQGQVMRPEKAALDNAKRIQKKQAAIAHIAQDMQTRQELPWRLLGEHLKTHGTEELKPEWLDFIDLQQSLAANIERCFMKAKENERKLLAAQQKIQNLEQEIEQLNTTHEAKALRSQGVLPKSLLEQAAASGRQLQLVDGVTAYIGKSGRDNLLLLRKAQAWDYWLHLRDYPGAYCILRRHKGQAIGEALLLEVSQWLMRETFRNSWRDKVGQAFEIILAECRYVTPVKGKKPGLVRYSHERVYKSVLVGS